MLFLLLAGSLHAYDIRLDSYPSAKAHYERANKGDADAAYNLAMFYDEKLNDNDKAIYWYKTADAMGATHAAYNLGYVYEEEKRDYDNALKWYEKAAKDGDVKAPFALGLLYDEHFQNYGKAIQWYTNAYEQGDAGGGTTSVIFILKL
jgi:TPR repeat protein